MEGEENKRRRRREGRREEKWDIGRRGGKEGANRSGIGREREEEEEERRRQIDRGDREKKEGEGI